MRQSAVLEVMPLGRRAREFPEWKPELRTVSPAKLDAAWQRARREARARGQRLSAMAIATPCGIDPATWRNWRKGVGVPNGNQLYVISFVTRTRIEDLTDPA